MITFDYIQIGEFFKWGEKVFGKISERLAIQITDKDGDFELAHPEEFDDKSTVWKMDFIEA